MFKRIMAPVDLRHEAEIEPALAIADTLAETWGASLVYVGVAASLPGEMGHSPEEFAAHLKRFAETRRSGKAGPAIETHPVISSDPSIDLDDKLLHAIDELGADLVVMQTHRPGWVNHWFATHGARLAAHAKASVFLVR